MITLQQFASVVGCTLMTAESWHEPFLAAMAERAIDTPVRIAAFLAQVGHESQSLSKLTEDMNYSAQRMMEVWPARFKTLEGASYYEHSPERLANLVYGARMGNGSYASGDGWMFRARGPIGTTGRSNYGRCGIALNLALLEKPDLLLQPADGTRAAAWIFEDRGCLACADNCDAVSDRINLGHATPKVGDAIGYADRKARFEHALKVLA